MKKYINKYNKTDSLLVITSFPEIIDNKQKSNFNAVSWHSQRTLSKLAKVGKVIVCAEKTGKIKFYEPQKNLLVARVWEKGNWNSFSKLFNFIVNLNNVKTIFVQFEFNVYGGIIPNILLLVMLFGLKLTGRKITFELHQVIKDIAPLEKHINIKNKFKQKFFNIGLLFFYIFLGQVVDNIIVFEQELKNRLEGLISQNKVKVLSLAVKPKQSLPIKEAKKKLKFSQKEFIVMAFGYINGYKGLDWIIKAFKKNAKLTNSQKIRLIIAGGKNPYLADKPFYQKFYESIVGSAKNVSQVSYTGFIPDNKVGLYFSAADLVVMPYEVFMSASGPFSLALSYKRPIIFSNVLSNYTKSQDFKKSMQEVGLRHSELFFPLKNKPFFALVKKAIKDKIYYQKLINFSKNLAEKRKIATLIKEYERLLFGKQTNLTKLLQVKGMLGNIKIKPKLSRVRFARLFYS